MFSWYIYDQYKRNWFLCINANVSSSGRGGNKLRTYNLFKHSYQTECYVTNCNISRSGRSALAKFRCGIAPLKIETGRYQGLLHSERFCFKCMDKVEDEFHVVMHCSLYLHIRHYLFRKTQLVDSEFASLDENAKFHYIMSCDKTIKYSAKACHDILVTRRNTLYN